MGYIFFHFESSVNIRDILIYFDIFCLIVLDSSLFDRA